MSDSSDLCPPAIANKGFSIGERIGGGSFSKIYKAKWNQLPGREITVKLIEIKDIDQQWSEKGFKKELKILKKLQYENIIKVYEVLKISTKAFIFMYLAQHGSIAEYLNKEQKGLSESQTKV